MRRFRVPAAVLVLLVSQTMIFCLAVEADTVIRVKGANSMAGLIDQLATEYMESHPGVSIVVSGGGTDTGFESMAEKRIEMVMASRPIYPKEMQALALGGIKPQVKIIGRDCVAFITRPDNPVSDLTISKIGNIYAGNTGNWKQVGGPDKPVVAVANRPGSGTALFLRRNFVPLGFFGENVIVKDYFREIVREVSWKTHMTIGYADLSTAVAGEKRRLVKLIGVRRDENSPAIIPSETTLADGSYPIAVTQYLYWSDQSDNILARSFADFIAARRAHTMPKVASQKESQP